MHEDASLAPILRSSAQGRLLAAVFDSDAARSISTLADLAGVEQSTASREIRRAERSGLVTIVRQGNTSLVATNKEHPLHQPVRRILIATYGVPAIVGRTFSGVEEIETVLLFGSWAKRWSGEEGSFPNDIDILLLGEPDIESTDRVAESLEERLGLPVQIIIRNVDQWRSSNDPFLESVKHNPYYVVVGDLPVSHR